MNQDKYDVAIAYRIYPGVSKVPPIFSDDKLRLSELCLKSFKASLNGLKPKIWAILDDCPPEYSELFKKYFDDDELILIEPGKIGNIGTFLKQLDILINQNQSNFIYFAEDDYFYLSDKFKDMLNLIKSEKDIDFITPYDHLDYYTLPLHNNKPKVIINNELHWRTAATTCLTFLTTKDNLKKTYKIFKTFKHRNYDASIWLSLTKRKLFNPLFIIKSLISDWVMFKILGKAWLFSTKQILFGKKYKIYSPIPSIATHMDERYLAPTINWHDLFSK
jgi:hypothetical protein